MDLVEKVYYLKQVLRLPFFYLAIIIDLIAVVYYLIKVFHLLYDKSVTPVKALLYFSLIS